MCGGPAYDLGDDDGKNDELSTNYESAVSRPIAPAVAGQTNQPAAPFLRSGGSRQARAGAGNGENLELPNRHPGESRGPGSGFRPATQQGGPSAGLCGGRPATQQGGPSAGLCGGRLPPQ